MIGICYCEKKGGWARDWASLTPLLFLTSIEYGVEWVGWGEKNLFNYHFAVLSDRGSLWSSHSTQAIRSNAVREGELFILGNDSKR